MGESGTSFLMPSLPELLMLGMVLVVVSLPAIAVIALVVYLFRKRNSAATSGYGSPGARLDQLAQLHSEGRITQAEYDARRATILGSI